jgi:hypothetical protein
MTLSVMTLSITALSIAMQKRGTQRNICLKHGTLTEREVLVQLTDLFIKL